MRERMRAAGVMRRSEGNGECVSSYDLNDT
jgi:hypothetical protein